MVLKFISRSYLSRSSMASWASSPLLSILLSGSSCNTVSSFVSAPKPTLPHPTLPQQMSSHSPATSDFPSEWSDVVGRKDYSDDVRSLFPKLSSTSHKGSHGRIAIFGGSEKYTGAPYYAASAALNCGVDLVTVFCAEEACIPIKCYSPELMVQSVYSVNELNDFVAEYSALVGVSDGDTNNQQNRQQLLRDREERSLKKTTSAVIDTFPSLHALCIGPGLGRHDTLFRAISVIIEKAIECNLSLILDADALYMLSLDEYRDLLHRLLHYENVVMTPNLMELRRLKTALNKKSNISTNASENVESTGVIVQKGSSDVITQKSMFFECKETGGLKRSGGIGDVLAGTISAFMAWNSILQRGDSEIESGPQHRDKILATWTACCTVKKATRRAFDQKMRSMSAQHVLEEIGDVIREMEQDIKK